MDIYGVAGHILPVAGLMAGAGIELRFRFWTRLLGRFEALVAAWTISGRG